MFGRHSFAVGHAAEGPGRQPCALPRLPVPRPVPEPALKRGLLPSAFLFRSPLPRLSGLPSALLGGTPVPGGRRALRRALCERPVKGDAPEGRGKERRGWGGRGECRAGDGDAQNLILGLDNDAQLSQDFPKKSLLSRRKIPRPGRLGPYLRHPAL